MKKLILSIYRVKCLKMKFILILLPFFSTAAFAQDLKVVVTSVPCQREILVAALAQRVQFTTLEALLSDTFEISSFAKSVDPEFNYIVDIETKSRTDQTTVGISFGIKVIDIKTCKVKATMISD